MLLCGCAIQETTKQPSLKTNIPLKSAKVLLTYENNKADVLTLSDVDYVDILVENKFNKYQPGDKLTIVFHDGKPYVRVER